MGALEGRQARSAEPQSQGDRVQRASARSREQPAGLRSAAPANEGNRDFRRAQGEQHSRRRHRGGARWAFHAPTTARPDDGGPLGSGPRVGSGVPLRVPRQPHQVAAGTARAAGCAVPRDGPGNRHQESARCSTRASRQISPKRFAASAPTCCSPRPRKVSGLSSSPAPDPGEGKSLFSSNLSVSLAQAGQRVLHVDADMRRPRVHAIFDLGQEPGLSNLLVGDCKPSEAIRKTAVSNLCVLPAGHDPAESG